MTFNRLMVTILTVVALALVPSLYGQATPQADQPKPDTQADRPGAGAETITGCLTESGGATRSLPRQETRSASADRVTLPSTRPHGQAHGPSQQRRRKEEPDGEQDRNGLRIPVPSEPPVIVSLVCYCKNKCGGFAILLCSSPPPESYCCTPSLVFVESLQWNPTLPSEAPMACNPDVLKNVPLFALLDDEETAVWPARSN